MPSQRAERSASLVLRAFVEESGARLIVRLVEVDPSREDRVVGVAASSAVASEMVRRWLDALVHEPLRADVPDHNAKPNGRVTAS